MSRCRGLQLYLTQSSPRALPRLLKARKGTILPCVGQDDAGCGLSIVAASTMGTRPRPLRVEFFGTSLREPEIETWRMCLDECSVYGLRNRSGVRRFVDSLRCKNIWSGGCDRAQPIHGDLQIACPVYCTARRCTCMVGDL